MTEHFDTDVAIIGYGPTGVVGALTLADKGASVIAFERDADIYPRARAVTINDWTMRIMQDLGIDERIEKVVEPQTQLRWKTYEGHEILRAQQDPSNLGTRHSKARFFAIYQPTMEAELRKCADERDGIDVRYGWEVTEVTPDDTGVSITARDSTGAETTVRSRYAIAADGGSSATRKAMGIGMTGETDPTLWIVIDCKVKRWWPDRDLLTFWSDKERPMVDIWLSAGHHRWEIPLKPDESESDYQTPEQVWPLLEAIGMTPDDVEISQFAFYRHHVRAAETWRNGRVFLAGDAAHLMPPWAGAGMQSGMRDAHNLGWKLSRVLRGEFDEAWLDTYEAERRPNVEMFTQIALQFGRVIKQEATPEELEAMNTIPQDTVTPYEEPMMAPPVLTSGWLRGEIGDASIVGRMIPQPLVANTVGLIDRLDELLGEGFVLLGDDVEPQNLLTDEEKAEWDALGARYLVLRPKTKYSEGDDVLIDLEGKLAAWFATYGVKAIALRPDKFVAACDTTGLAVPAL